MVSDHANNNEICQALSGIVLKASGSNLMGGGYWLPEWGPGKKGTPKAPFSNITPYTIYSKIFFCWL